MKLSYLLIFTLLSLSAFAAEQEKTPKKSEVQGDIVVDESMQVLLNVNGVKPIYEDCKSRHSTLSENIPTCIWQEVSKNSDLKKQVLAAYSNDSKSRAPASSTGVKAKTPLTNNKKNVGINYETDPSVVALTEFYGKKLGEILDPNKALTATEKKSNVILTVDHKKFIELYKSELGKTIISAFTSYCLDTEPASCNQGMCQINSDETKIESDRKANLASLNGADLSDKSTDGSKWKNCIVDVGRVCDDKNSNRNSKQRACLIVDYVKSARKNIIAADAQQEFYKSIADDGSTNIASNMKIVADGEKSSTSAILNMTEKDVQDSVKVKITASMKDMDSCYDDKTDQIKNIQACQKFLDTDRTQNEKALAEFGMRQLAQEETLKEELNSSDDKVRDYLKEEGYKDEEIQKLTEDKKSIEEIKDKILERFKNEKQAIIAEMAKKIESKTSTGDKIDANADKSKISKIRSELLSRGDDLGGLVKFNNIVSSYLSFDDESTGKTGRNTASLFAEAKTASDEATKKALQEQIKAANLQENKDNSTINLNVDTINASFLKYNDKLKPANANGNGKN